MFFINILIFVAKKNAKSAEDLAFFDSMFPLSFGKLRFLPGFPQTNLLTLHFTCIASHESRFAKRRPQVVVVFHQSPVMPWRIAPAWPKLPPPRTVTLMSKRSVISNSSRGCRTIIRATSRPKYPSSGRRLIVMLPLPLVRKTRAVEVLRRPVP